MLIFYGIASGKAKWGWLAVLYKTLFHAPAGFAAFWGTGTVGKIWILDVIIAIFGLTGLFGTIWFARRYVQEIGNQPPQTEPPQV